MSNGTSWFSWFSLPVFAPFSGAVTQDIHTSVVRGDPATEAEIFMKVGLGRQLGILSEALEALIDKLETTGTEGNRALVESLDRGNDKSAFGRLRVMMGEIETIKGDAETAAREDAKAAIARLQRMNPSAAKSLLDDLA